MRFCLQTYYTLENALCVYALENFKVVLQKLADRHGWVKLQRPGACDEKL